MRPARCGGRGMLSPPRHCRPSFATSIDVADNFVILHKQKSNLVIKPLHYFQDGKRELYRAYYIDRNVMAYINSAAANSIEEEEFDEIKDINDYAVKCKLGDKEIIGFKIDD